MDYIIYKHTNKVNGKSYIGQTCRVEDPNLRWCAGKGYSKCRKFYNAIKKYGWDAFEHTILAVVHSAEDADNLERKYIKEFNTILAGYNITPGGAGRHAYKPVLQMTEDKTILARFTSISEAELALNYSFRHSHIAACCSGKLRSSHEYFWCYEVDYPDYKIKAKRAKPASRKTKTVYQLDRYKHIIAKFPSALAAFRVIQNKPKARHGSEPITECCKGNRLSAYNYWWCYAHDYDTIEIKIANEQKCVLQLNLNDEPLAFYYNLKEAALKFNTTTSVIGAVCSGKRKQTKGFHWQFIDPSQEEFFKNLIKEVNK